MGAVVVLTATVLLPAVAPAVTGNVAPSAIEIDAPNTANLYPGGSTVGCNADFAGSVLDWVKDCAANTDAGALQNSIATGLIPGVTSKVGGTGHWNGVRIVDGVAGGDQDIFLRGGKENDLSTWDVGAGTVGSSKYDATQAYLANNLTDLFFGMERRGNNGTTAFDYEFNQAAPPGGTGSYLPTRTVNDVLLTFVLNGSGGSGSASAHYFTWNGSAYVEQSLPVGTVASINDSTTTPAAPWGHVSGQGNWTGGNLERFEFGEAKVPLSVLPGVNNCGGKAYVQLRTRSSATDTSDLKDTTKIFEFLFGEPVAKAQLATNCLQQFTYGSAGSTDSSGGPPAAVSWDMSVSPTTATLSGGGVAAVQGQAGKYTSALASGTVDVALPTGVGSAVVTVKNTISAGAGCTASSGDKTVTVYRQLGATATLSPSCDNTFTYSSTVSGGKAPYSYVWTFQKNSAVDGSGSWSNVGTRTNDGGTFSAGSAGAYRALLSVTDSADGPSSDPDVTPKPQCNTTTTSNTINVYDAVGGSVGLTPDCDGTFGYSATGSGGKAPYSFAFTLEKQTGANTWATAKTFSACTPVATAGCLSTSGSLDINSLDSDPATPQGEGTYRLKVTITDSQGIVCTVDLTSTPVEVRNALTASAVKTSASASAQSVLLTASTDSGGNASTGAALQWQRKVGADWVNIASASATTLTYSSFEADSTATNTSFVIGSGAASGAYEAQLHVVELRVKATRILNGTTCEALSSAVTVKKVKGVDP